ncbi:hypothetical protein ACFST9_06035 [Hymenobacter monticola]|uniref:Uncharacterized protein n=1 Tax=Hymenobacter monticola TaxID=1705399 RepID=A0ABY4BEI9_9BACT|nr:hypothetical protein [Hymenobacter monticola]UOE36178.1 hypothetical protein MTP16_11165 [Hymenobacter monticola]
MFVFNRRLLIILLVMFFGMVLWMAYFFYFHTDGRGHVLREADSPAAEARGQQLLGRADNLLNQRQYDAAKTLLDSLRDADLNPAMFIADDALEQRFDTLRRRRFREKAAQQ